MSKIPEEDKSMQDRFIQVLKTRIPANLSLVDEMSDALGISIDSAYRRIRGEKIMLLDEVVKLSKIYGISLDSLTTEEAGDQATFSFNTLDEEHFTFRQYLEGQLQHLQMINKIQNREIIYAAKDLPAFYYYAFPDLAAFKLFVWKKSIMGLEEYQKKKFRVEDEKLGLIEIGRRCLSEYCKVPGSELWNDESVNSTLRQIEVYYQMGVFENLETTFHLLDLFEQLIGHIKLQADCARKFFPGETPQEHSVPYRLYNNQVVLCDNSILVATDNDKRLFLTHNTLNYLYISNKGYCETTYKWMKNLEKRSSLISEVSEKERHQFFRNIHRKIEATKQRLKADTEPIG